MLTKKALFVLAFVCLLAVGLVGIIYFTTPPAQKIKPAKQKTTSQILAENNIKIEEPDLSQAAKRPVMSADDHIWGKIEAPVKIIVYSDFTCPFCLRFYETTQKIKQEFGDKVAIAFRYFPLPSHQGAFEAAMAAECAAEQDKFWPMHDKLFTDNKNDRLTKEQYLKDAQDLKLDVAKFSQCLEAKKYKEKIAQSYVKGKSFDILGTPTVFVDNEIYPGAYPFEDFVGPDGRQRKGMKSIIERHLGNL
jgi:protein-disulfide isomerase